MTCKHFCLRISVALFCCTSKFYAKWFCRFVCHVHFCPICIWDTNTVSQNKIVLFFFRRYYTLLFVFVNTIRNFFRNIFRCFLQWVLSSVCVFFHRCKLPSVLINFGAKLSSKKHKATKIYVVTARKCRLAAAKQRANLFPEFFSLKLYCRNLKINSVFAQKFRKTITAEYLAFVLHKVRFLAYVQEKLLTIAASFGTVIFQNCGVLLFF